MISNDMEIPTPSITYIKNPLCELFQLTSRKKILPLEAAIVGLSLLLFIILSLSYWGFFQDDAYVILRYAKNLLEGNGLTFNAKERVEGYTELLWTLLVTGGIAFHLPPVGLMKVVSMVFGMLTLVTLWLCARLQIRRPISNAVPSLFLAVSPSFVLWSQGGLGTMLFDFLIVAHFYQLLRYFDNPTRYHLWMTTTFMALAILSRPEAIIYLGVSMLVFLINVWRDRRWMDMILFSGISLMTLIALYGFRLTYYGDFYPNTYYAKVSPDPIQWVHGMKEFGRRFLNTDFNMILLVVPLLLLFRHTLSLGAIWLLISIVTYTIYYLRIGTDLLPMNRLYQPTYAFLYLVSVDVFGEMSVHLQQKISSQTRRIAVTIAIGLICLLYTADLISSTLTMAPYRGKIACSENSLGYIGRWLETHAHPEDKVSVTDVGATSYYAMNLYVIDLLGLTDRTIAHALYENGYNPWLNYLSQQELDHREREDAFNQSVKAYFIGQQPRYIVLQINVKPQNFELMQHYLSNPPVRLDNFLLSHVVQYVPRMLFADTKIISAYHIVLIRAFDPYYAYYLLLERDKEVN